MKPIEEKWLKITDVVADKALYIYVTIVLFFLVSILVIGEWK